MTSEATAAARIDNEKAKTIAVTGASGKLGGPVLAGPREVVPSDRLPDVVHTRRDPLKTHQRSRARDLDAVELEGACHQALLGWTLTCL